MKSLLLGVVLVSVACAHGSTLFGRKTEPATEAHYALALRHLDSPNQPASLDSALTSLDAYIASKRPQRLQEATALRRLILDSQQLARIEALLLQRIEETPEPRGEPAPRPRSEPAPRPRSEAAPRPRDERSVREINRLRQELREANAELERIRKRLAAPKTDSTDTK